MPPEVTIIDIARILGLSKSTVSRALTKHADVNPETRQRVIEVASMLDYQPNIMARSLKQKHTNTLGVIIPETMNRFFARAVGGIQKIALEAGYNTIVCQSSESITAERSTLKSLIAARVDGILISVSRETNRDDHFKVLLDKKIPVVFFDRICESVQTSRVVTNNYEIAFEATQHLIEQGANRVAIIAGSQHLVNSRERFLGYVDALKKHGLSVNDNYIVHSRYKSSEVEEYTRFLIDQPEPPNAIFAINDFAALKIMYILKKNGLRIPEDIAVMGFNNEDICPYLEPSLSSVDLSAFDLGTAAAETLIALIKTEDKVPAERVIKSKLVIRESTLRK